MGHRSATSRMLHAIRLAAPPSEAAEIGVGAADGLLPLIQYEQVGAWLWHRLRQSGQLSANSPRFQKELRDQGLAQAGINLRIAAVTAQVLTLLADHGIRPVLLKGVACCALAERYPFFRYRQTSDADLLVEPGAAERAWRLLRVSGFREATTAPGVHPDHHHLPTLISDAQVPVEIHSSASLFWSAEESWARFGATARAVAWQGAPALVPANTELLWHGVAHSLGDGAPGCRLRNFLTAAAFIAADHELDWDIIRDRIERDQLRDHDSRHPLPKGAVKRWLAAAAWIAGRELPMGLGRGFDPESDLTRLVGFRKRRLAAWPSTHRGQQMAARWMEEAARAQFTLGLGRRAHWQTQTGRPRRLASSLVFQSLYRMTSWRGMDTTQ